MIELWKQKSPDEIVKDFRNGLLELQNPVSNEEEEKYYEKVRIRTSLALYLLNRLWNLEEITIEEETE